MIINSGDSVISSLPCATSSCMPLIDKEEAVTLSSQSTQALQPDHQQSCSGVIAPILPDPNIVVTQSQEKLKLNAKV